MSIATEIQRLADNKAAIKASIEAKSPTVPPTDSLAQWPEAIDSIPSGGEQQDEWTPPSDWPDIRKILKDDVTPQAAIDAGATHKWIMLCNPVPSGNGLSAYSFTSTTNSVYFRISNGYTTTEHSYAASDVVEPLLDGGIFWIIVYCKSDKFCMPGPSDYGDGVMNYNVIGPTWVYAPDLIFEDSADTVSHKCSGWTNLEYFECGYVGKNIYCKDRAPFYGCHKLKYFKFSGPVLFSSSSGRPHSDNSSLESIDTSDFDVSLSLSLANCFVNCGQLTSLDVSRWDVSSSKSFSYMFSGCSKIKFLDVSGWDVSAATNMSSMFNGCNSLKTLDVSRWDVHSVTSMNNMFLSLSMINELDVSKWNVSAVTNMSGMFSYCCSINNIDVSGWDVSAVTNMSSMFNGCAHLISIDVSKWNLQSCSNAENLFAKCSLLETIIGGKIVGTDGNIDGSTDYFLKGPKTSFSIAQSTVIDHDSLIFLLYWIRDLTGSSSQTISVGSRNKARLTAEEIAIATAKNWTVA